MTPVINACKNPVNEVIGKSVGLVVEYKDKLINRFTTTKVNEVVVETIESIYKDLKKIEIEIVTEDPEPEVDPVIQTHVYPVWKDLIDNLRANNGIAEIEGKITHVAIVGIIGDDLVIIPTKAIKVKDKLNWKAELKALKLDDKIVLESDKFIAKLDVITDALDIEEMIRKYNDSVEADKQFTGFINI